MAKKEIKKVKKNKKVIGNTPAHYNEEVVRMAKIGIAVLVTFAIIYFATGLINKYRSSKDEVETEIQNVEILMGETFEKKDNDYIIVYYDFEDKIYADLYGMMVENYNSYGKEVPMYKVDLSTNFSKKYIATGEEASNTAPTALSNLKVKGATLIRIQDKTVVTYLEGKDAIKNYVDELVK
jgi:hypothetical protein